MVEEAYSARTFSILQDPCLRFRKGATLDEINKEADALQMLGLTSPALQLAWTVGLSHTPLVLYALLSALSRIPDRIQNILSRRLALYSLDIEG